MYKDVDDQVIWTKSKDGKFIVESPCKALETERQGVFPTRVIWDSWVPLRVGFFAWEAT